VHARLRIAIIAHDGQKQDLVEWAVWDRALLSGPRGGDAPMCVPFCGSPSSTTWRSPATGAPRT